MLKTFWVERFWGLDKDNINARQQIFWRPKAQALLFKCTNFISIICNPIHFQIILLKKLCQNFVGALSSCLQNVKDPFRMFTWMQKPFDFYFKNCKISQPFVCYQLVPHLKALIFCSLKLGGQEVKRLTPS